MNLQVGALGFGLGQAVAVLEVFVSGSGTEP